MSVKLTLADLPPLSRQPSGSQLTLSDLRSPAQFKKESERRNVEKFIHRESPDTLKNVSEGIAHALSRNLSGLIGAISPQSAHPSAFNPLSLAIGPQAAEYVHQHPLPVYKIKDPGIEADIGKGIGQVLSALPVGGPIEDVATQAAEHLPGILSKPLATRLLAQSASGAATAPLMNLTPGQGAQLNVLMPRILRPLPQLVVGIGKALRKLFIPTALNKYELKEAYKALPDDITMPLGHVAQSPRGIRLYGVANAPLGSKATAPFEKLVDHLHSHAEPLGMGGSSVVDPQLALYQDLTNRYKQASDAANQAWLNLRNADTKNPTPLNIEGLKNLVKEKLDEFEPQAKRRGSRAIYQPIIRDLKDYEAPQEPEALNTVGDAINEIVGLNRRINQLRVNPANAFRVSNLTDIKKSLEDAIDTSLPKNSPKRRLYKAAKDATRAKGKFKTYDRRTATPFYNIYRKSGTPENLISQMVKPSVGTADYSGRLEHNLALLSPSSKNLLRDAYLKSDDLEQFNKRLSNLNEKQKDLLFGADKPKIDAISDLITKYPDILRISALRDQPAQRAQALQHTVQDWAGAEALAGHPELLGILGMRGALRGAKRAALRSNLLKNLYLKSFDNPNLNAHLSTELAKRLSILNALGQVSATQKDNKDGS
ncbi:MAG: hypothetical protein ACPGVV_01920 [Croceimicrobium sp.]